MIALVLSPIIEAAIVGRPVHTIVVPEFAERQEGTVHFHYLKSVGGGVFQLARNFDEHRAQLAASLREPIPEHLHAGFVRAFVRPFGLDRSATGKFGEAVLDLGHSPASAPARAPVWAPALRLLLRPVALATHATVARIENPEDRTVLELQRARRRDDYRRQRDAERQRQAVERENAHRQKIERVEAARQMEQRARRERIEASEREKRARKTDRVREKEQRSRAKRRAAMLAQIKRRLGWKQAP
jgi:flagellar biosynthesis GTPase FlhF